jgi:hypothetical protein
MTVNESGLRRHHRCPTAQSLAKNGSSLPIHALGEQPGNAFQSQLMCDLQPTDLVEVSEDRVDEDLWR